MPSRVYVNNAVMSVVAEKEEEIKQEVLEEYSKLKEKCDKVINKIKNRKSKASLPPPSANK